MTDRRNINRGYKKLRVWNDAIELYVIATEIFKGFPFEYGKIVSNCLDSCHSISRNIAEGFCRRSLKEYLNFLNISLGSCGEFHSSCCSFLQAKQITDVDFEKLDKLHFKLENELIKLIETLQNKKNIEHWQDSFA